MAKKAKKKKAFDAIADGLRDAIAQVRGEPNHGRLRPSRKPLSAEEYEAALEQQIARRLKEVDEGRVKTVPWDEARRRIKSDR